MTLHSLPLFVRLAGRPVMLLGEGEPADAKRRLLERAGAVIVGEAATASLAIVAIEDDAEARGAIDRLTARGVLVNAVDRPDDCDFTLPAIIDRSPVLIAIGTGGASAGLAAALRQRLEAMLPATLGPLADRLNAMRGAIRLVLPALDDRRRALGRAFAQGGALDPLTAAPEAVPGWLANATASPDRLVTIRLTSDDPDDLTLGQARALALADRIYAPAATPPAILDRSRADAVRIVSERPPVEGEAGLTIWMELQ
ncbi:precorrin-2 dehydrogenase/sirohydrochlorin ferrochelatase family protein [Sphingomonas sp. PAMC 26617]|uniref:precorrin-2 dehydrogenase/sirohydrochlorin ferrochelatase family protein n=1 Tax=Sphingomonas sp. PAMC 26617 TaxID=1112216 RepID=UPI000288C7E0|nr:NAD(P)-dependent oxidoreductase [Sphingomonas sp. PAMC 26617]